MHMPDYDPTAQPAGILGCAGSWLGGLFRSATPDYAATPSEPVVIGPSGNPGASSASVTARVRGVDGYAWPTLSMDGSFESDPRASAACVTLIVDDDDTANALMSALRAGAAVRVAVARAG
jgi:hypothetical protein